MSRPVKKKPRIVVMKRPYATHYYEDVVDKEPAFKSQGAAASETGAIRATVVRIFVLQYKKAIIHDRRSGIALYTVKVVNGGLHVSYGSKEGQER